MKIKAVRSVLILICLMFFTTLASGYGDTVMVPLVPLAKMSIYPPKKMCPLLKVQHKHYVLMTHIPGGIPPSEIGEWIKQLDGEIYEVKNAFDFLLNGI